MSYFKEQLNKSEDSVKNFMSSPVITLMKAVRDELVRLGMSRMNANKIVCQNQVPEANKVVNEPDCDEYVKATAKMITSIYIDLSSEFGTDNAIKMLDNTRAPI